MKFLSLLLGLVIFVAILYQGVFTPAVSKHSVKQQNSSPPAALQTLEQAQQLKQSINTNENMDYKKRLENH